MKRKLNKVLALVLSLVLLLSFATPAFAKESTWISQSHSDIPLIRISGDGEKLVDENGDKVFHYKDALSLFEDGETEETEGTGETEKIDKTAFMEATVKVMLPFLINGLLHDDWEPFYQNLQKVIGDLFERSLLDKDGNPQYGTGLRPERLASLEEDRHSDKAWRTEDGQKYYLQDRYWFVYDWRLDPIETAADFKAFIDDVLAATGCEQAGIIASCLGTNVVTAYLAVYPEHAAAHIRGVAYDGSVVGGAEMLSEIISGRFNVNAAAANRLLIDCGAIGLFDVDSFVNTTLEMLGRTGMFDVVDKVSKKWIYYKLVEGVTSALALSTFYTWPNYWACVTPEDYDTAMHYVFGPEGSEKRTEYAGLIAKLDRYNETVRQRVPEILTETVANGIHFGVISKYGFQTMPTIEDSDIVSDQFASVRRSSFGATTGTLYQDLAPEYLAERTAAGYGAYLSPDGQIDASTCLFPESTWFIKGSSHSNWSDWELRLLYDIASSKEQLTVDNTGCWPSRFVVYTYTNPEYDYDGEIEAMTTENCDTENWEAEEKVDRPTEKSGKIFTAISSFIKWLLELILKLFRKG